MAASGDVLARRNLPSSTNSTSMELFSVLQGLATCSKSRLHYDVDWKPTSEALEEFSKPPALLASLAAVSPSAGTFPRDENSFILSEYEREIQESEDSDFASDNSVTSNEENDLEDERIVDVESLRNVELLEKELQASFDGTDIAIHHLEIEKKRQARERLNSRIERLKEHSKKLQEEKHQYLQQKESERVGEFIRSVQALQLDEKRKSEEARLRQQKLEQSHEEYKQRAVRRVKEVEALRLKVLKQEQQIKKELMQLEVSFNSIRETASNIQQIFQACKYQSSLSPSMPDILREVDKVLKVSQNSVKNAHENGQVTEMNVTIMQECTTLIQTMLQKAKSLVQEVTTKAAKEEADHQAKAKEEVEKKEKEKAERKKAERAAREKQNNQTSTSAGQPSNSGAQQKAVLSKELSSCISETAWKEYSRLVSYKSEIVKAAEPLNTDKSMKQLKFDLQKAVATPINSISEDSILDKIQRINKFLSGGSVQVGRKQISTAVHPAAKTYCKELIARKLVDQGSQQVSSSISSAFPIAAVAIGIWSSFPEVGDLILVRFYEECPFLVPFYIPKAAGMSDSEYFASLGYLCSEGQIEQQDKFLKRMTGIVRLYAAIVSSLPPPSGQQSTVHPHGPEKGWTWLARMLNLEPRPDYTATALYEFLAVAGHVLMRQYKKQFGKLLNTLVLDYVPKIEKVTAKEQSGPVSRLKIFLEKCIKDQKIPVPEGYLTQQWWRSSRF